MERWKSCVAVVTGASSGIGESIAKDLVKAGLRVVALGRRQERLDQNRSKIPVELQNNFFVRKCDIRSEAEVKSTFEWIDTVLGGTDILVNNAGIARRGPSLLEIDTAIMDDILNTNVKGLIYCTQAAFKSMKTKKFNGHLIHINSIAGHKVPQDYPNTESRNMYSPSKFAVTAINETIRTELRNIGMKIKTTSVSPGLVRTEIAPQHVFESIGVYLNPEDVSQAVLFAISTPPHVQIHEIIIKPIGEIQ